MLHLRYLPLSQNLYCLVIILAISKQVDDRCDFLLFRKKSPKRFGGDISIHLLADKDKNKAMRNKDLSKTSGKCADPVSYKTWVSCKSGGTEDCNPSDC